MNKGDRVVLSDKAIEDGIHNLIDFDGFHYLEANAETGAKTWGTVQHVHGEYADVKRMGDETTYHRDYLRVIKEHIPK